MIEQRRTPLRPKVRLELIDALRGFTLLNMLIFHLLYDLTALFGVPMDWFWQTPGRLWQKLIAGSFIFLSGFSIRFSRSSLRKGLMLLGCGMLLSLVTWLVMPSQLIRFGVLHFLGAAALLWIVVRPAAERISPPVLLIAGLLLYLITLPTQSGYWGIGDWRVALPQFLYAGKWLFPLGFPGPGFYSADYFPLLPWFFLFLAGTAANRIALGSERIQRALRRPLPLLSPLGRHTLIVYLLHQPILYGLCWLWFSAVR